MLMIIFNKATVIQKLGDAIHRIKHHPAFEQLRPKELFKQNVNLSNNVEYQYY